MEKLSFRNQIYLGLGILTVAFILASVFNKGILYNFAWVIYGLLFILNPVLPKNAGNGGNEKKLRLCVRISGGLCVLIGLITSFNL